MFCQYLNVNTKIKAQFTKQHNKILENFQNILNFFCVVYIPVCTIRPMVHHIQLSKFISSPVTGSAMLAENGQFNFLATFSSVSADGAHFPLFLLMELSWRVICNKYSLPRLLPFLAQNQPTVVCGLSPLITCFCARKHHY